MISSCGWTPTPCTLPKVRNVDFVSQDKEFETRKHDSETCQSGRVSTSDFVSALDFFMRLDTDSWCASQGEKKVIVSQNQEFETRRHDLKTCQISEPIIVFRNQDFETGRHDSETSQPEISLKERGGDVSIKSGRCLAVTESCTARYSSRFENNCSAVIRSSSKEGSYLRLVDLCITQL